MTILFVMNVGRKGVEKKMPADKIFGIVQKHKKYSNRLGSANFAFTRRRSWEG